jgi:hypothetical protein
MRCPSEQPDGIWASGDVRVANGRISLGRLAARCEAHPAHRRIQVSSEQAVDL